MPELPEVETVVKELRSKILGHKIVKVETNWPKAVKNIEFKKFKKEVCGLVIEGVERKGKYIFLKLFGGKSVVIHLRMTGNLLISSCLDISRSGSVKKDKKLCGETENDLIKTDRIKHIHFSFSLNKNKNLLLMDLRKFATIELIENKDIEKYLSKIGIDAIDKSLSSERFFQIIQSRNTEIKKLLLNQKIISGIGNIYADEILFEAKVSPKRKTKKITRKESEKIFVSTKTILKKAIEAGGTSFSDFRNTEGKRGSFGPKNKAYKKEGTPCPYKCGHKIEKINLGGRGTRFCPHCQV